MSVNTKNWTHVWRNVHLATMSESSSEPYGALTHGAIACSGDKIAWIGTQADLPVNFSAQSHDGNGCWITPGLIDCHTHIVYGGNRAGEFEQRLTGVSYDEIARSGGGIVSTVKATRQASFDSLYLSAQKRLGYLIAEGVTGIEIKSGYGLDLETEVKMLEVARKLENNHPVNVATTYLGAHALPPEENDKDSYIKWIVEQAIPAVAQQGVADAVDVFCENIAFSAAQCNLVFAAAKRHGLPVKAHVEQLSNQGGAALAASYDALSADHLEYLDAEGVAAMKASGTVAVLLPGAFYYLRETKVPPIELLRGLGVPMAIATDCNPGSSPALSLLLMLNMACTLFRFTPEESLLGVTRHAARALGWQDHAGTLDVGKRADFVLWDIDAPGELAYAIGGNPSCCVIKDGEQVSG